MYEILEKLYELSRKIKTPPILRYVIYQLLLYYTLLHSGLWKP